MRMYIPMEFYTLTLTHKIRFSDGNICEIEEPITLETCVPRYERFSTPIIVSEMADRMKGALLGRIRERTTPTDWSRNDDG